MTDGAAGCRRAPVRPTTLPGPAVVPGRGPAGGCCRAGGTASPHRLPPARDGGAELGVRRRQRGPAAGSGNSSPLPAGDNQAQGPSPRCLESHTRLADLVTDASWLLFQLLQLNARALLERPVSAWEEDDGYRAFRDFVRDLNVTNDAAERGVAMTESFTNTVTRDEAQLQWLPRAAEDHRKRVPTFNKDALGAL